LIGVDELQKLTVEPMPWDAPQPRFPVEQLELVPAPAPGR
jgi:hypothetical protein